jgi:hypothetical protein
MTWAQRLRRVFNIDITECEKCQKHNVTIIACIIDTVVIQKIMAHLDKKHSISIQASLLPPLRAPPNERYAKISKSNATSTLVHRQQVNITTKLSISW